MIIQYVKAFLYVFHVFQIKDPVIVDFAEPDAESLAMSYHIQLNPPDLLKNLLKRSTRKWFISFFTADKSF